MPPRTSQQDDAFWDFLGRIEGCVADMPELLRIEDQIKASSVLGALDRDVLLGQLNQYVVDSTIRRREGRANSPQYPHEQWHPLDHQRLRDVCRYVLLEGDLYGRLTPAQHEEVRRLADGCGPLRWDDDAMWTDEHVRGSSMGGVTRMYDYLRVEGLLAVVLQDKPPARD